MKNLVSDWAKDGHLGLIVHDERLIIKVHFNGIYVMKFSELYQMTA